MTASQQEPAGKYIHTLGMTKEEWLAMRRPYLGASEWGPVLELSDYEDPHDVWAEKVLGTLKEFTPEQEEAMEMGLELEPVVASRFAKATGAKIMRDNKFRLCQKEGYEFLGASLDRIAIMPNGERSIVEIKTVVSNAYRHWEDEVPMTYYAQIQAQMLISQIYKAHFAILIDGRRNKRFEVPYDPAFIELAMPRLKSFWESFVIPEIEPPKTVKQFAESLVLDTTVEVDAEGFDLYSRAKDVRSAKATIEKTYGLLTDQVKALIGESTAITYKGEILATWKRDKSSIQFDEELFAKEQPELYAQYSRSKMGSRRLILK